MNEQFTFSGSHFIFPRPFFKLNTPLECLENGMDLFNVVNNLFILIINNNLPQNLDVLICLLTLFHTVVLISF